MKALDVFPEMNALAVQSRKELGSVFQVIMEGNAPQDLITLVIAEYLCS